MGYRLNRLDEPVFIAVSKPLLTEFGIHHRLESCDLLTPIGVDKNKAIEESNANIHETTQNPGRLPTFPFTETSMRVIVSQEPSTNYT